MIHRDRYLLVECYGASMAPLLRTGDLILVDRELAVRTGDVAMFSDDVAHRVLWVEPLGRVWECGDHGHGLARRRRRHEVVGRVVGRVRAGAIEPVGRSLLRGLRPTARAVVARARAVLTRLARAGAHRENR